MPVILLLGIFPALSLAIMSIYFARQLINYRRFTTSFTIEDGLSKGEFSTGFMSLTGETFCAHSPFGYDLCGFVIPGNTDGTMIFCHGASWTRWGMAKYVHTFYERGWNIVAYDHRGHGESGGTYPTYGYFEKHDLKAIEDWTMARFPNTKHLGVFGESMGAATALQYAPMSTRVKFLILESPFSDLDALCRTRLAWAGVPGILIPSVMRLAGIYIYLIAGFHIRHVSPRRSLKGTDIPMIFFHGINDEQVPASMSVEMYNDRNKDFPTRLALFDKALHSQCIVVDEKRYLSELWSFLSSLGLDDDNK